jgi:formylglycine-generating enzyme required for sulfatase activity
MFRKTRTFRLVVIVLGLVLGSSACAASEEQQVIEPTEVPEIEATLAPLGQPGNPVVRNMDWEPVVETIDGAEMALVPVGCFMMGSDTGKEHEAPIHEQCFAEPFWIDVYEVTRAQFDDEATEGARRDLPANYVDWFDAVSHCEARGGRLPTEAEWEYAARGPDELKYPWRHDQVSSVFYCGVDDDIAFAVGSTPLGHSWVGAFDLAGNAWEWTHSIYAPYPFDSKDGREVGGNVDSESPRVKRGGSCYSQSPDQLQTSYRRQVLPGDANEITGFRCMLPYLESGAN